MEQNGKKRHSRWTLMNRQLDANSPSIMQSLDSMSVSDTNKTSEELSADLRSNVGNQQSVPLDKEFESLNFISKDKSFQIIDNKELLQVSSVEQFLSRLEMSNTSFKVKVVSIFGNAGDGKSYTLNHTFFGNQEVFKTSSSQSSCTLGAWVAYDPKLKILCLDTEGLLNSTNLELQTTRLLLKIIAVSDVVVYKTRTERLPRDMFMFLGSASKAFTHHFQNVIQSVEGVQGSMCTSGPALVILHESSHTKPLQPSVTESPEDVVRNRFAELNIGIEAFSSLRYIGRQTLTESDFMELKEFVRAELENQNLRTPRHPSVVFETIKVLNEKFSGEMGDGKPTLFPDEYFTCSDCCLSCGKRCELSVGHLKDNVPHTSSFKCKYQHQYDNNVYMCKRCIGNGIEQIVVPIVASNTDSSWYGLARYVWSGYTIECPTCGVIYSSRQFWYGNKTPEETMNVRTKVKHIWPGAEPLTHCQNTAQKVVDGVTYLSEAVASVCSQPTKMLSSYVADQIAPKYWRPNDQIKHCHSCKKWFPPSSTKHHCRNCGEGFCESCSSHYMPVPKHGWYESVRVCTNCYNANKNAEAGSNANDGIGDNDIRARKYGEVVISTLSSVANVFEYPKELIKGKVRPSYWVPDDEITDCCVCKTTFGPMLSLHHCRDCGRGVCGKCSANKKPVPKRNWENPVRVCDECYVLE